MNEEGRKTKTKITEASRRNQEKVVFTLSAAYMHSLRLLECVVGFHDRERCALYRDALSVNHQYCCIGVSDMLSCTVWVMFLQVSELVGKGAHPEGCITSSEDRVI